ncbi:hypothetical protein ACH4GM_33320 [Streptomyces coeruleorubidus]|uniref:hypothetical protein n=1 Tax=Streptomyces coeruleorubidus TaxID=116188 RepID=UPI00378768AC
MRWRTWLSRRCSSPRGPSYDTAPAAAAIADTPSVPARFSALDRPAATPAESARV